MSTQLKNSAKKASSNNLNRQVTQYSLAAAVAGVSMLALVAPAAGEVVVTKKTIPIPLSTNDAQEWVKVSMANNGVNNFSFALFGTTAAVSQSMLVGGVKASDEFLVGGDFYAKALALQRGAKIGPSPAFFYEALLEATVSAGIRYSRGYWGGNTKNRYLGVSFPINGQTHYGWIRLTVTIDLDKNGPRMTGKITGYAYETIPNKAIKAGTAATDAGTAASATEKPTATLQFLENIQNQRGPSLGMLAAGAEGMPLWRREETSVRQ
jgi:hypothetical protein